MPACPAGDHLAPHRPTFRVAARHPGRLIDRSIDDLRTRAAEAKQTTKPVTRPTRGTGHQVRSVHLRQVSAPFRSAWAAFLLRFVRTSRQVSPAVHRLGAVAPGGPGGRVSGGAVRGTPMNHGGPDSAAPTTRRPAARPGPCL